MYKFTITVFLLLFVLNAAFAQNGQNADCQNFRIDGKHQVKAGELERYQLVSNEGQNEFRWQITGADKVDGIDVSSGNVHETVKSSSELEVIWREGAPAGKIVVEPMFPCPELARLPKVEFPIIIEPANARPTDGGPNPPLNGQECDQSIKENNVWKMWANTPETQDLSSREFTTFICDPNAAVGLGTSTPSATFHNVGTSKFGGDVTFSSNLVRFGGSTNVEFLGKVTSSVLIGERYPRNHTNYKLAVDGKIVCTHAVVTIDNWADYVFDENYQLRPLTEVEKFIKENNHLPDVPSEAAVKSEGLDVGEMDAILLRKIEELTLYMIELKKENEQLKKDVELLKSNQ